MLDGRCPFNLERSSCPDAILTTAIASELRSSCRTLDLLKRVFSKRIRHVENEADYGRYAHETHLAPSTVREEPYAQRDRGRRDDGPGRCKKCRSRHAGVVAQYASAAPTWSVS